MALVVAELKALFTSDVSDLERGEQRAIASTRRVGGEMERTGRRTDAVWTGLERGAGRAAAAGAAGLAVMQAANVRFDKSMSKAGAATMETEGNLRKLREAAIQAGADTSFSATEAADGITELAKAGVKTKDILSGGLRGALDLAAAGNLGVGESAEYVATALTQFQLQGDKATHVADLLAAGAGKAQGEVADMALALNYAGVPAAQLGVSIEETAGTIALFAKNGLIGEKAGTAMRGMLASLTAPSVQSTKLMKELGLQVFNSSGEFVGFDGVAGQLQNRMKGLTDAEKSYYLGKIFGTEQMQAANILMREGADGVRKWTQEVDAQGYAGEQAARMMDNLAGDIEKVKGAIESAFINGGGGFQDGLRDVAQGVGRAVDAFNDLPSAVQENSVKAVAALTAAGGLLWTVSKVRSGIQGIKGLIPGGGAKGGATGLAGQVTGGGVVDVFVTNPGFGGDGGSVVGGAAGSDKKGNRRQNALAAGGAIAGAAAVISVGVELAGGKDVVSELGDVTDSLNRTRDAGKGVEGGFMEIRGALEKSNVGKYAQKLGLDLNRLAADIAINGDQGKYLDRTMKALSDGGLKDAAAGLADFLTPGWDSRVKLAGRAVDDLGRISKNAGTGQREAAAGGDVFAAQLVLNTATSRAYAQVLRGMPKQVITEVQAKGTDLTRADVRALKRQYDLTPKQVRTLMGLVGDGPARERLTALQRQLAQTGAAKTFPFVGQRGAQQTAKEIASVLSGLNVLGRGKATPKVQQQGASGVIQSINDVKVRLADLNGYTANTFIRTTRLASGGNKLAATPLATGGPVTGPGGPTSDDVLIAASNGEFVLNAAAYGRNRRAVEWMNAGGTLTAKQLARQALAAGGPVGTAREIAEAQQNLRSLKADMAAGTSTARVGSNREILEAQLAIEEIDRQLRERRTKRVKVGKGKKAKTKEVDDGLEVRGTERAVVQARRVDAVAELDRLRKPPPAMDALDKQVLAERIREAEVELARLQAPAPPEEVEPPAPDQGVMDAFTGSIFDFGSTSATRVLQNLQRKAVANQAYTGTLAGLMDAGLDERFLKQFIAEGPSSRALKLGQDILTRGLVGQYNAIGGALGAQAQQAGQYAVGNTGTPMAAVNIDKFIAADQSPTEIGEAFFYISKARAGI